MSTSAHVASPLLALMQTVRDGGVFLLLPAHAMAGSSVVEVDIGRARVDQEADERVLGTDGRLCPGPLLVAVDSALGRAAGTAVPSGSAVTTLDLHVRFLDLAAPTTPRLVIEAESAHVDGASVVARGHVREGDRLVALISTRCGVLEGASVVPHDPWAGERGASAELLVPRPWTPQATSPQGLAPLATHLLRAEVLTKTPGPAVLRGRVDPDLANSRGHTQGGVLGLLAEQALALALSEAAPGPAAGDAVDLQLTYVRPVVADGSWLEAHSEVLHAGRSCGVARGEVRLPTGCPALLATVTRYRGG